MKSGQLLADEVLPKFAKQLEITWDRKCTKNR
jgi:hypothetical protein